MGFEHEYLVYFSVNIMLVNANQNSLDISHYS